MAETITTLRVSSKQAAIDLIARLALKYKLKPTDPDNVLDMSGDQLHAFYDSDSQSVTVETSDTGTREEYFKELLMEFPTFF
jgi:hypothetical protein